MHIPKELSHFGFVEEIYEDIQSYTAVSVEGEASPKRLSPRIPVDGILLGQGLLAEVDGQ